MKKRWILCALLVFLYLFFVGSPVCKAEQSLSSLEFDCRAWIVMDRISGRILGGKNQDNPMDIASTTKIMTAIIVIETLNLDDIVTIDENAASTEGSSMYLAKGQKISVRDLLYGLILMSGNDSAVALAGYYESVYDQSFIAAMNEKAQELGLLATHFENPHGLDQQGHYSSANDLAVLTKYGLENEFFAELVRTKEHTYYDTYRKEDITIYSTNKFLQNYSYARGVKTGYTEKAGRCLVGYAVQDEIEIITVVLDSADTVGQTAALCEFVFENYQMDTVIPKGTLLGSVSIADSAQGKYDLLASQDIRMLLTPAEKETLSYTFVPYTDLRAPLDANTKVAEVVVKVDGTEVYRKELKIMKDVEKKQNIFQKFLQLFSRSESVCA